ncbi:MAG: insulinase family protein [Saprospiraceae bacterium]|nr:insulinase family protein [Saprospiraceae bacterium]
MQLLQSFCRQLTVMALFSLLSGHSAYSQNKAAELPEGVEKVTSVEGITEYRLKNGLRVLLFPDPSKATITVNITYLVGSRHEGYGETGMAHLLEHLVFKGTPKHPNIPQELTEHGARPNGTTWYDRTNYFETFAASDVNLRWALDLEADRMINSYIAKKDLDSEMTVVRNEYERGENFPGSILTQRVTSTAYLWHNYGKSTIGAKSDLENVPIERLQAFYKKYYQPDNAVLLVGGKIDEQKTLQLVHEYFSGIPRPERFLYPTYTREPVQDGERSVTLRRVGDVQVASCFYHICAGTHSDFAPLTILLEVLTSEPSGRLYKALVESKKASSQYGYVSSLKEDGYAYFSAEVLKDKSLEDALSTMMGTLDQLKDVPITQEEIERAKTRLLKDFELNFNNSERVGLQMSEYLAKGDWRLAYLFRDNLEKVTIEDVKRVAGFYFKPSNRTIGRFIPEEAPDRVEVPEPPNVEALVKNYKGKQPIAQGEVFDATPQNIETRTKRGKLPNGLKYALLPKETRGDVVTARITLRYGDANSLKNKQTAARYAGAMLNKGTLKRDRQGIEDELDRLKARVFISGGGTSAFATIETDRKNLPEVIALVKEMLQSPSFDENEFEKLKQEDIAGIEQQKSEPTALARNVQSRLIRPYEKDDVRYTMTFDEETEAIKKLTLAEVKQFHKDFYGASNATVSIVGDFDEQAIRKSLEENFGKWKSPKAFTRIKSQSFDVKPTNEILNTPDKSNGIFLVSQNIPMRNDHPDFPAMVLGNYMLGGGFLNSRLAVRIRQKEGISYSVGSGFSASPLDETATFNASAIYAPENVQRLEQAFKEEIERVIKEGFTQEEIDAAKSGWLQSQQVTRSQDGSVAGTLESYLFIERDYNWDADLEKKIGALTPEQIHKAMKTHIKPEKFVMIKAGDFEKVNKAGKP